MKTKWRHYILWSILSLGLFTCAVGTSQFQLRKGKEVLKLGKPKSKPVRVTTTGGRKSLHRSSSSTVPLSQLSSQRPDWPLAPAKPRSMRPRELQAKVRSEFAYLPDVSVTCSTSDVLVRVNPAFYGLGAEASELKLGSSCKSNGVLRPYGDLLFTYPLTACDAMRQLTPGYLVYKFVLHYEPSPKRFPSRAHRIDVNIKCRYQRNLHVYQLTVKPTWESAVVRKRLIGSSNDFQMELMDDSWSRPSKSQVYQLGKAVNFQVSAPNLPTNWKLYISSCFATPASGFKSPLKYTIIDNFGCMMDSWRAPGASQFISRTDKTLRFSLKAFQFTSDPNAGVNIHCKLFVTSEDPSPTHKSCTYKEERWKALTGDNFICECCDSQCGTSEPIRATMEGSVSIDSLLVSDQDDFLPVRTSSISRGGEAIISHYIDELNRYKDLLESLDVVKYDDDDEEDRVYTDEDGELTEPDLEELGLREVLEEEEKDSAGNYFILIEDEGSGHLEQEDYSESEEGREDEMSAVQQVIHQHEKEAEVLRHWVELEQTLSTEVSVQRELQQPQEDEEGNMYPGRDDEDRMVVSEVQWKTEDGLADDGEQTWYFSW
ncbi:uncharacterized protein si:ch211-67f13.7 [Labrus bergylta]|uniref:Zona pellucida sperm-binding protein 3 n=1 Tax=Labrus bergylta TaxID=56723 RepID=A0A3Q3NEI1_9LABR|nr:uncharacterized protein LOC109981305 [Labrus bergylta]